MDEIKNILKKHDIGGFLVIHTPGHSEFLNQVSPSYSCAFIENGAIRVKLKTAEVGKEKARQLALDTLNMVSCLAKNTAEHAILYMELEKMLKEKWSGEDFPGERSSHEQQNN